MAGVFILVANFSIWLGGSIFNQDAFSETAVTVIRTRPVRDAVSATIIDEALKDVPELRGPVSSSLKDVISGFLAGSTARPVLESLAKGVNKSFTAQEPTAVKLDLRNIIEQIQPFLATLNREFGVSITTAEVPKTIVVVEKGEIPSIYGWGVPLLWLGPVLGVFGLALIIGSIWFAGAARALVLRVNGVVLAISALLFLLLTRFAATPLSAMAQNKNARLITLKLFDAFSARLAAQTWLLVGVGVLLAATGFLFPRLAGTSSAEAPKDQKQAA